MRYGRTLEAEPREGGGEALQALLDVVFGTAADAADLAVDLGELGLVGPHALLDLALLGEVEEALALLLVLEHGELGLELGLLLLELGDLGAVQRERALDAHAEAQLAHGECLARALTAHADDVALEYLLTLALTLTNAVVHADVVAHDHLGQILANLCGLDGCDVVNCHGSSHL